MIEVLSYDKALKKRELNKELIHEKNQKWIYISKPTKEDLKILQETLNLHDTTIEDLELNHKIRPKIEEFNDYVVIILYPIESNKEKQTPVKIIIGKNYILTTENEILEKLKNDQEELSELLKKGNDFLLHAITEAITESYFPKIETLDNELDTLENDALNNPNPKVLERLFKIKRELLKLRKIVYPQREIIANLSVGSFPFLNKETKAYFRDVYDNMIIITDLIEDQRETISSILEVHLSVTSNKLNEVMKVLTVVSTVLMPLTVIVGIYGTNFKYLPELNWHYGYFFMLGIMLLIFIGTLLYLKFKKRWI